MKEPLGARGASPWGRDIIARATSRGLLEWYRGFGDSQYHQLCCDEIELAWQSSWEKGAASSGPAGAQYCLRFSLAGDGVWGAVSDPPLPPTPMPPPRTLTPAIARPPLAFAAADGVVAVSEFAAAHLSETRAFVIARVMEVAAAEKEEPIVMDDARRAPRWCFGV